MNVGSRRREQVIIASENGGTFQRKNLAPSLLRFNPSDAAAPW